MRLTHLSTLQGALVGHFCILGTVACVYFEPLIVTCYIGKGSILKIGKINMNFFYFINDLLFKKKNGKKENLVNFFNINFAKARSKSFCCLQYIENWKIDLIFFNINFAKPWSQKVLLLAIH